MPISLDEIKSKASEAVIALGDRAERKGRREIGSSSNEKGWVESALGGSLVNVDKFLEAAAYYRIAANIIDDEVNKSFLIFREGVFLEEAGAFSRAIEAYSTVAEGEYSDPAAQALARCRLAMAGSSKEAILLAQMNALMPGMAAEFESLLNPAAAQTPNRQTGK